MLVWIWLLEHCSSWDVVEVVQVNGKDVDVVALNAMDLTTVIYGTGQTTARQSEAKNSKKTRNKNNRKRRKRKKDDVQGTNIMECNCRAIDGRDEVASREFGGQKEAQLRLGTKRPKADGKSRNQRNRPSFSCFL